MKNKVWLLGFLGLLGILGFVVDSRFLGLFGFLRSSGMPMLSQMSCLLQT